MSSSYYYLVASLPSIAYEGKPSMSIPDYLSLCQTQLSSADYDLLFKVLNDNESLLHTNNEMIKRWMGFNHDFRNEIAYFRAKRANKDPKDYLRGEKANDLQLTEVINQAARASDPLVAEKILVRRLWELLEDLTLGHYFDLEIIIAYGIKLRILDRFQKVASPDGQKIFEDYKKVHIPELSQRS